MSSEGSVPLEVSSESRVCFSIVIATLDRPAELSRCITAIGALSFPRDQFEVIVVNDGGEPPPADQLRRAAGHVQLRILSTKNGGPGAARNAGVALARGDFLAFIDDDCTPPSDWLLKLAVVVDREPDALIGGHTVNVLKGNLFSQASQLLIDYVYAYYNEAGSGRTSFFSANNMVVAVGAFRTIGGFDEAFMTAEDRELCNRWSQTGGRFHYAPEVIMYHSHHLNLASLHRQHFGYGRGALPYWQKTAARGVRGIRVEPLAFYAGMLLFPFTRGEPHPAMLSALVFLSQVSNAAGFACEGLRRLFARASPPLIAGDAESA
jgi:GT2 family glycosyltransferase